MRKRNKTIKVMWNDAVSYYNFEQIPDGLSHVETVGELVKDEKEYIYLKNPKTKDYDPYRHKGVREKKKKPTFLYIPRGMIVKIEEIT